MQRSVDHSMRMLPMGIEKLRDWTHTLWGRIAYPNLFPIAAETSKQ